MVKIKGPNITRDEEFNQKLQQLMGNVYDLIELTKEYDLQPTTTEGVILYFEDQGKTCFQASGQYDRPNEFLQVLLDIIRVNYEPSVLGTFFLNSNLCFLYDEVPNKPFHLGYASLVSGCNENFGQFYSGTVTPYLSKCGYSLENISTIYAVASTGDDRYGMDFLNEVSTTLESGFSISEALTLLASSVEPEINNPQKQSYAGYCLDSALENRVRLSLWFFIPATLHSVEVPAIH